MALDGGNHDDPPEESDLTCVEPSDTPCLKLVVVPLSYFLSFIYDEQDWDVVILLVQNLL